MRLKMDATLAEVTKVSIKNTHTQKRTTKVNMKCVLQAPEKEQTTMILTTEPPFGTIYYTYTDYIHIYIYI